MVPNEDQNLSPNEQEYDVEIELPATDVAVALFDFMANESEFEAIMEQAESDFMNAIASIQLYSVLADGTLSPIDTYQDGAVAKAEDIASAIGLSQWPATVRGSLLT